MKIDIEAALIIGPLTVAFVAVIWLAFHHHHIKSQCMEDHKEYECEAMLNNPSQGMIFYNSPRIR